MAILHRRGRNEDFDAQKMLAGEMAVTTDGSRKAYVAFGPGDVKELAGKEDVQNMPSDYQETVEKVKQHDADIANIRHSKADAIIVEKSGKTIVATDSTEAEFESFKMFGESVQNTTSGAQLFDDRSELSSNPNMCSVTDHIIKVTSSTSASYVSCYYDIPVEADKVGLSVYLKVGNVSTSGSNNATIRLTFFNESGTEIGSRMEISSSNITRSVIVPDGCTKMRLVLYATYNNTCNAGDYATYEKIMVSYSNVEWEPYTGGMAAPNPDYPQEIKSVVVSEVKTHGKNLLNTIITSQTVNGVTFTVNDDKSVTVNGTATDTCIIPLTPSGLVFPSETYILSGCPLGGNGANKYSLRWNGTAKIVDEIGEGLSISPDASETVQFYILVRSGVTCNNLVFKPMLRLASIEDDTYEPYTEQILHLDRVLNAIPVTDASLATYTDENGQMWCADEIDVERGVYIQRIAEKVFDGTESITGSGTQFTNYVALNYTAKDKVSNSVWTTVLSNILPEFKANQYNGENYYGIGGYGTIITFKIPRKMLENAIGTNAECVNIFKEFLVEKYNSGNPIKVYYQLATPIETPLPEVDQVAFRSLKAYDGVTYVTTDSEVLPTIEVKYVADTKKHIEQNYVPVSKYTALEDRVSALERLHV